MFFSRSCTHSPASVKAAACAMVTELERRYSVKAHPGTIRLLAHGAGIFQRRRPGDSRRRWQAELRLGKDRRDLLRFRRLETYSHFRGFPVHRRPGVQSRPRAAVGIWRTGTLGAVGSKREVGGRRSEEPAFRPTTSDPRPTTLFLPSAHHLPNCPLLRTFSGPLTRNQHHAYSRC